MMKLKKNSIKKPLKPIEQAHDRGYKTKITS
jgi:hypothetical protein